MCLAIPGKVLSVIDNTAVISMGGLKKEVNISLIEDIKVGEYIIIHGGCAIEKITGIDLKETIDCFKELFPEMEWEDGD